MLEAHYRIGQSAGVAIHILRDGEVSVNACSIVIKDNKLSMDKKVLDLTSIDRLKQHFPPKSRIAVNLFGKGILQKQIARRDTIDSSNFSQILPNGNIEDFYIQHFPSGEHSFVSVIRKSDAEKWIGALEELDFLPLMLSLGVFPVQNILEQVNVYDGDFVFDGHIIKQNAEKEWLSYNYVSGESAPYPLKVGTSVIEEKLLLPYAAAFQIALMPDIDPIAADVKGLMESLSSYLSERRLKVKGFIALLVFFLLLLTNFIVLSFLDSSNEKLASTVSVSARNVTNADALKDQIGRKEAILKALGWDEGASKSKMIDQLAALLPHEVRLHEISINPVDKAATSAQKTLTFADRKIKITGTVGRITDVNEWTARAKTLKWVKGIQMDSYVFNSELGTGQFTLILDY